MTDDPRSRGASLPATPVAHPSCGRCQLSAMDHLELLVAEAAGGRLRSRARFQLGIVRSSVESGQGVAMYVRIPSVDREPIEVTYVPEEAVASFTHTGTS